MPAYLLITQISGAKKTLEEQKVFLVNRFDCLRGKLQLKSSQKGKGMDGENSIHELFPFNNLQEWEGKVEIWTGDLIWHPDRAFSEKQ